MEPHAAAINNPLRVIPFADYWPQLVETDTPPPSVCQLVPGAAVPLAVDVVAVHDGDTFTVLFSEWPEVVRKWPIRIAGIDAPELTDPRPEIRGIAERAALELVELFRGYGNHAWLANLKPDKYFRLLADVSVGRGPRQVDVGKALIAAGLARPYAGRGPKPW